MNISGSMAANNHNNYNMNNDGHNENKFILVQRYKLDAPAVFLHYTTFCNLVQMPAWVNIMGQHSSIGEELKTYSFHWQSPTVYDYFGIEMKKLSVTTSLADGRCTFHRPFTKHNIDEGLAIFLQTKPNYFLIESKIYFNIEESDGDGRVILVQRSQKLFVPVIFKDNFYYICPGQEESLIYRIHHPTDIFFTSKGHHGLRALIGRAFTSKHWCYVGDLKIVLPKESKPVTNWDMKSDFDIGVCVPYPIVSTNTVPESSWCSVQPVRLDDRQYIKDVVVNYREEEDIFLDESEESDDNMENEERVE